MKKAVFILSLCTAASVSATRLPMQGDIERCTLGSEDRGEILQGKVRLELLVRKSGVVYGAFTHSARGVDDRRFMHCLAVGALNWELPAVAVDYQRPYAINFVYGGADLDLSGPAYFHGDSFSVRGRTSVFLPDPNQPEPVSPADVSLAQNTLEISDKASDAERGIAFFAVGEYGKAAATLRDALERDPADVIALRGLARTLAAQGKDLKEARAAAEKLIAIAPGGISGHEALLDVCLAAHDDDCAVAQFRAARNAEDMQPRSRILAELQDGARASAQRIATASGAPSNDPCGQVSGEGAQALCVVKRCLDDGTAEYARELSEQNHVALTAGDWKTSQVADNRYVVRRAIEGGGQRHDATWLVTVADDLRMKPASSEARQITLRHSRCAPRTLGSR